MADETGPEAVDHEHRHHGHEHGHANDQGIRGAIRYLRQLPRMWHSEVNDAVVALIAPQPGERGVDIGAGMGAGAMPAAAAGITVIAVEPTPFMRRVLRMRRATSRRRSRVQVVDGAVERIPVGDHSIDAVWAVNTMHHWVDIERGAAEIARVLRPNGRLLLVDEDFSDPTHPDHHRFGGDHDNERDDEHRVEHHGFTMVDAEMMGGLLRAAGLTAVDTSTRHIGGRPVISVTARGVPTE